MRIKYVRGLAFMAAVAAVAVGGLSCGGGSAGGAAGGGRTTIRFGIVTEGAGGVTGVAGQAVYGVVATPNGNVTAKFTPNASDPTFYELTNPPAGLIGFFVVTTADYYQVCQWPYVGSISNGWYQFPIALPFNATQFAIAPLTGPFNNGVVNDEGIIRLAAKSSGPPPLPDFP